MVKEYNTADVLKRVELCLVELGIPKEKFYAESGISSASYSQWNKGIHEPTSKKVKQMADYLGVTLHYLLTGEGQKEAPPAEPEAKDLNRQALFDVIDRMSAAELVLLLERAERIIESRG